MSTDPKQPVVYDMMLLADALLALRKFETAKVGRGDPAFCEKQKNLETALTKIRGFAQFLSPSKDRDLLKVTDSAFGGASDGRFQKGLFDRISKYVSHLHEQRWRKGRKYPRLTADDTLKAGRDILTVLKPIMDRKRSLLKGDARHWYSAFADLYGRL